MDKFDQFIWRKLKVVIVPDPQNALWTPALDFLIPNRLYKLRVHPETKWKLESAINDCSPDGYDGPLPGIDPLICMDARWGALIGKVGGGTADKAGIIFGIGRYCVYKLTEDAKGGPLYLGANNFGTTLPKVTGQFEVEIEMAL